MFALLCTGASSQIIGRPVVWLDDQRWGTLTLTLLVIATCSPLVATAMWSLFHGPRVWLVSIVPTIGLVVLAALDRHNSPGSAVVTLLLGVAGALSIVGAFAGRYRLSNASSATTASS
jgi:cytochrome bd-type quinol oxidase subunit 2